jgi:hypothetical protein
MRLKPYLITAVVCVITMAIVFRVLPATARQATVGA